MTYSSPRMRLGYNQIYISLSDIKKQIIIACACAGKAKIIWSKASPSQPDKLRQIILIEGKKYLLHFWKNNLTNIYLIQKT